MDHRGAIEKLTAIEAACDVNAARYRGLRVWPLVRLALWSELLNPGCGALKGPQGPFRVVRLLPPKDFSAALQPLDREPDVLLHSRWENYQHLPAWGAYDRIMDPFVDLLGHRFSFLKLAVRQGGGPEESLRHPALGLVPEERPFTVTPGGIYAVEGYDELRRVCLDVAGMAPDESRVLLLALKVVTNESLYSSVLREVRPGVVLVACYYDVNTMGLVRACRRRGVPVADVQHGKQGIYHGLYTHWTALPPEGYDVLPGHFWNWGPESVENIARTMGPGRPHAPVAGGNLWLSMWAGQEEPGMGRATEALDASLAGRKAVLVSLQPLADPLPGHLLQAMARSPRDWLWLIRHHPLRRHELPGIVDRLVAAGVVNCRVDVANEYPLYALLRRTAHHLTCFSSVCYEALAFGQRTTLVHESALALYGNYLDKGLFRYADTADAVLESVARGLVEPAPEEERPYLVTDPGLAASVLGGMIAAADGGGGAESVREPAGTERVAGRPSKPFPVPVALVAYNRPWHTAQVLDALKLGRLEKLYVFCDAARTPEDVPGAAAVRRLVRAVDWTDVEIVEQVRNQGLAKSIVRAADHVFRRHERMLLLEDDIVPFPTMFSFIESALDQYREEPSVAGISAWSPPFGPDAARGYPYDAYFFLRMSSWGWATWRHIWERFDPDLPRLAAGVVEAGLDLSLAGTDISPMLERALGGGDMWAINWALVNLLHHELFLYPVEAQARNIGHDGTGVHCGRTSRFDVRPPARGVERLPESVFLDAELCARFYEFVDLPGTRRERLPEVIDGHRVVRRGRSDGR